MKRLYLKTKVGIVPIDPALVSKYNLRMGTVSPFTGDPIVDKFGNAPADQSDPPKGLDAASRGELSNGEIAEIDNALTLSQSEIIDFGLGVDSSNG